MPIVQLKLGDMFDGPADLIVLPSSTSGTITSFVRERLVYHRIPYPKPGMKLGDLTILPFDGGENIAQYVAFAASVQADSSTEAAIRRIGEQLGAATMEYETIRLVSAPLLGAGAGKLRSDSVVDALSDGFKATAHRDARLVVHTLHRAVYDRLLHRAETVQATDESRSSNERDESGVPPRVFISYSHTSPAHVQWVEQFGTFLRQNGIDARLDVWHLRHGMDLPQFMTNELTLAARVIIVSDEKYAQKADGRVGGVGWETMIVQGDMSRQLASSTKYLAIVRSADLDAGLPQFLKTKLVIHWPDSTVDERNRHTVLRELYDIVNIPPLGPRPIAL